MPDGAAGKDNPMGPGDSARRPPARVDDQTVAAVGTVSEALEWVERARGHLYSFHQLIGHADLLLGEACEKLRRSGHAELADRLATEMVGRNVIQGLWTFQIVEDFDDNYWSVLRKQERAVRDDLMGGRRHVFEAEMKVSETKAGSNP